MLCKRQAPACLLKILSCQMTWMFVLADLLPVIDIGCGFVGESPGLVSHRKMHFRVASLKSACEVSKEKVTSSTLSLQLFLHLSFRAAPFKRKKVC